MPTYTVTVRYDDSGEAASASLTVTAAAPAEAFTKDGDTYRITDDSGDTYVFPEGTLIYMKFAE